MKMQDALKCKDIFDSADVVAVRLEKTKGYIIIKDLHKMIGCMYITTRQELFRKIGTRYFYPVILSDKYIDVYDEVKMALSKRMISFINTSLQFTNDSKKAIINCFEQHGIVLSGNAKLTDEVPFEVLRDVVKCTGIDIDCTTPLCTSTPYLDVLMSIDN